MGNIFLLALGSRGDVQPLVALAVGLHEAGHEVTIATPRGFTELVGERGLCHVEVSDGITPTEIISTAEPGLIGPDFDIERTMSRHPVRVRRALMRGWLAQVDQLMELLPRAAEGADLVIWWDPFADIARHLAESFCVPGVATGMNPDNWMSSTIPIPRPTLPWPPRWLPASWLARYNRFGHAVFLQLSAVSLRSRVNPWRHEVLGLPALPRRASAAEQIARPALRLSCVSPYVRDLPPEWRDSVLQTGQWLLPPVKDGAVPPELRAFLDIGPAPIFASMGSATAFPPELGPMVVKAARYAGVRLVLGTGWRGRGGLDIRNLPDGVIEVDDVPHENVFPSMLGIIHHGGGGSTAAALRAGVPSMALPMKMDQPYWGRRITALGVGPDPIPAKKATVEKLVVAMCRIANDEPMRRRAAELGECLRSEDSVGEAVRAIEGLLPNVHLQDSATRRVDAPPRG